MKHRTCIHTVYKHAYSLFVALKFQEWGKIRKNYSTGRVRMIVKGGLRSVVLYCFCIAYSLYILWKIVYPISSLPYYTVSFLGAGTHILFISQWPVPSTEPGTQRSSLSAGKCLGA